MWPALEALAAKVTVYAGCSVAENLAVPKPLQY
jgi:hypothetical protein